MKSRTKTKTRTLAAAGLCAAACLGAATVRARDPAADAQRQAGLEMYRAAVRPLLEKRCVRCHGGEKIKGEFDLTTRETLLAGGESGAAIDLKRPSESLVLALLRREEKPHMPPKGDPVDQETIGKLAVWIALGAPYDEAKPLADAP